MRATRRSCIVEAVAGSRVAVVAVCALACGCVESRFMVDPTSLDGIPQEQQRAEEPEPPVDSFWLEEAIDEQTRPRPHRPRSISLGYIGDAPLSGGVMRDTPAPSPTYVDYGPPQ